MTNPNASPAPERRRIAGVPVDRRNVTLAVLVVLAIWFVVINTGSVTIHLYFHTITAPMWLVLVGTLLGGTLIGMIVSSRRAKRRRDRARA